MSLVTVLACSGCAMRSESDSGQTDPFSGPWGASLQRVRDESDNETVRKVLEDGVIDDAEQAQIESDMTKCMADLGYEWTYIDKGDGGEAVNSTERTRNATGQESNQAKEKCGRSTGFDPLLELARQIRNNPEHKNPSEPIFDCLQRKGLIDRSITFDEYWNSIKSGDMSLRDKLFERYEDPSSLDYDPQQAQTFQQCAAASRQ
ncbi:hypothetical protein [Bifidobacterium biavatii]|uniref:hypothetical protein n=1 Tax=Bifidobacterium biavatii TaxID=762212 RepID=UPI0012E0820A|nr:hypothetical protein [Bifidobacterium biavatii]